MAKDIYLYGSIWEDSALFFMDQIAEAIEDDPSAEFNMIINLEGGSPAYGMSVINKVQKITNQIAMVDVEAMAHSMGLFILLYIDSSKVQCMDTTQAVLHRAAYPSWMESSSDFASSIYAETLARTNKDLEKAMRAKIDVSVLESLPQFAEKNITLKDVFSMESRIEVLLTPADLKKLGLVSKINKITPTKSAEIKVKAEAFSKCKHFEDFKMAAQVVTKTEENQTQNTMTTLAELKEKYPHLYAQAVAEGHKQGVADEKDRVGAFMVFAHLDLEGVKKSVASGEKMTQTQMAEFGLKQLSQPKLAEIAAGNTPPVVTTETATTAEALKAKEVAEFEAKVKAEVGIGKDKSPVTFVSLQG
jgi:ATP-dependent protease ClpP protease subunit